MKKSLMGIVGILMMVVLSSGCVGSGSGNVVKEVRNVSGFNQISVDGNINVILKQGNAESVEVEAEDNIISNIKTQVTGNKLNIQQEGTSMIWPSKPINVYVTVKDINSIEVSGSSKVKGTDIDTDDLNLSISGSGTVEIENLTAKQLKAKISGAGNIELSGVVAKQELTIEGSGDYKARDLKTEDAVVTINGAGNADVNTSKKLEINITGAGNVSYLGSPTIKQNISGSGNIKKLN
ncbi:MAG: head GIN domain-containing protein [Methanobacteriaceae archaeon]|nr:head GIN domain-containing protein [Methanobacteriaceae archaeon]